MLEAAPRRGSDTRERILEIAEAAVLAKGFAATSIDELIAAVGITKSGFFYHFKDKGELAKAMLLRYLERDKALLDDMFARADELNEDPLHGFLVGLKLFAEMMANLPKVHPSCLATSFCYQDQLFNREIRKLNAEGMLAWRIRFRERLDVIAKRARPKLTAIAPSHPMIGRLTGAWKDRGRRCPACGCASSIRRPAPCCRRTRPARSRYPAP